MATTKIQKFQDKDYRHAYAESFLDTFIATQIRVLREQREWTQADLAEAAEMKQSRISTIENANYSGWSLSTLKRLARAFDVPLFVSFGTFGRLVIDVRDFKRENLERPEFAKDPLINSAAPTVVVNDTSPTGLQHADTMGRLLSFKTRSSEQKPIQTRSTTENGFTAAIAGVM